ncbi:hypothetical protein FNV43_RR16049 [Rhamnella rubrinervis]|uniref:F-box domain-containing protein n=1 Tax=Rhamnella rubrinervis TaxID=2594499 RepID=A0A8K0E7R1_9ROSA|nr:hypothetical protein FNV43_RR16049 [Rhamnella rubrinervis]
MEDPLDMDFVSDLPQSIIETILTGLPIRDAVRTSILSSKWRYKWSTLTQLVFDEKCVTLSADRSLVEKNLLTRMELFRCELDPSPSLTGFLCLKSLNLHQVIVDPEAIESLISSCPLLGSLALSYFDSLALNICVPNLKYLCLEGEFKDICLENTPLLVAISVAMYMTEDIAEHFEQRHDLERLTRTYRHLKVIELYQVNFEYMKEILVVLRLIMSSPNLEELHISVSLVISVFILINALKLSKYTFQRLKLVKMTEMSGVPHEMEFIKFLLDRSPELEIRSIMPCGYVIDGRLNMLIELVRDVPDEVYKSLDAVGDGEKWWESVELTKLILAHNNIQSLKEELKNLAQLTVLNISHNKLSELPAAIGELSMLKSLDVSFNSIQQLPEEIGSATSLVKIDCSSNRLKEIPSSIGRCVGLSDFKSSNNNITSFPEDMANCSKLIKLDVEGNKLTMLSESLIASWTMLTELNASKNLLSVIPENIGSLSRLIRLDLHQNRISSIPSSIVSCCSLVEFYMGNNALLTLPAEMGELSRLGTLDLHSNQLKEYPVEACKLHLSVLDLSNNSLTGLPPELGNMTTLRRLLLAGNPLRTLRSSLVSGPTPALLRYLRSRLSGSEDSEATTTRKEDVISMAARMSITSKELCLEGLGLTAVPSEVWESGEVIKVDLSKNSIQELPVELSSCSTLETLILSRNKIQDWPGAIIKSLPNLLCLKLDNNPLRQLPLDGFQAAPKLQVLDLTGNAHSLPDHPAFSCLPHLQELYLRRMQLHEVPSEILCLQKLRILDLSQNSLQSISVGFRNLTSLTELDLSDNNISALPPELGLLEPSLQVLRLDGNPLRSIRRTILDTGTKAVLKYLKDKIMDP